MSDIHVVPVVFARSDSSRFPRKNLLPLHGSDDLLTHVLAQLQALSRDRLPLPIRRPVVATTGRDCDAVYSQHCEKTGAMLFRGSLMPLSRLQELSHGFPDDWLLRVNADSPLLLFPLIEKALEKLASLLQGAAGRIKLVNNLVCRSFPYGISLELFSSTYIQSLQISALPAETVEHITPLQHSLCDDEVCCIGAVDVSQHSFDSKVRLTIDTEEDYEFFVSLFADPVFSSLQLGSMERVLYAYRTRNHQTC